MHPNLSNEYCYRSFIPSLTYEYLISFLVPYPSTIYNIVYYISILYFCKFCANHAGRILGASSVNPDKPKLLSSDKYSAMVIAATSNKMSE